MKPEFSKPFDLAAARAGAPFCLRDGGEATVLKWDCRNSYALVGVTRNDDNSATWSASGQYVHGGVDDGNDLVMLPLGLIDGKPVFVGDEVLAAPRGDEPELTCAFVGMTFPDGHAWKWPAPTKAYPETAMTDPEIHRATPKLGIRSSDDATTLVEITGSLRALANAALRHAVDAGQVAPVSEAQPGVRPHNPYTGALRDPLDIETDPMGALIRHPDDPLRGIEGRAARDATVARAVRDVCISVVDRSHTRAACELLDIDLAAITQSVQ